MNDERRAGRKGRLSIVRGGKRDALSRCHMVPPATLWTAQELERRKREFWRKVAQAVIQLEQERAAPELDRAS